MGLLRGGGESDDGGGKKVGGGAAALNSTEQLSRGEWPASPAGLPGSRLIFAQTVIQTAGYTGYSQ